MAHPRTKDVLIDEDVYFASLISDSRILDGLLRSGYERPSPIQLKAIPLGRLGLNLVAQAKSGTGKTVVFGVIALEGVKVTETAVQALIIAPTRELATQIKDVVCKIGQGVEGLGCHAFIGGMPAAEDTTNLLRCQIAVGTPGRIKGLIVTGKLSLSSIKLVVLDEADKLMEDVFRSQIKYIFRKLPDKKQVLAFSATYDDALLTTLDRYVQDPHFVMLSSGTPALEGVCQYYKTVDAHGENSTQSLMKYEIYERKFREVAELFGQVPFYQCIVFLNHRGRAIDLAKWLTKQGWQATHIAASLSQRERLEAISSARDFRVRVLVCSDLIARGIDIDRVNLVVNLDLPRDPETYLHRVGRTGRFGTSGLAVSFVDDEEMSSIRILQDEYGVKIRELPEIISPDIFTQPLSATDQEAFVGHEMQRQHVVDHPEKNPEPLQPQHDHARLTTTTKFNGHSAAAPRMRPPHKKPGTHAPIDMESPGSAYQDASTRDVNADHTAMYNDPTTYYAGWHATTTPVPYYEQRYPYPRAWPYYYHQTTPVRNWAGPGVEWDFIPPDLPF